MSQELSILIREALNNARENGYDQSKMTLPELASDLIAYDADIEKFDYDHVLAELQAYVLEQVMANELQKLTGQELLDFSKRIRNEGVMAMIDITFVDRSLHTDAKEKSAEKVASIKEIIADCIEFVGKYKIARNS